MPCSLGRTEETLLKVVTRSVEAQRSQISPDGRGGQGEGTSITLCLSVVIDGDVFVTFLWMYSLQ